MLKTYKQIITNPYSDSHHGVDLRSWDFKKKCLIPIIAPEPLIILRTSYHNGKDKYGNNFLIARGVDTRFVLKFIHVDFFRSFYIGEQIEVGQEIGYTEIGGNSTEHHLHFETWEWDESEHFNPEYYMQKLQYDFDYKWNL